MTASLFVTPEAELDLTAIFLWYERQRDGLGTRFIDAADELFMRIRQSPRLFPEVVPGYRRALFRRFPYGTYFSQDGSRVVVHAVLHLHRDPGVWRRRLLGSG